MSNKITPTVFYRTLNMEGLKIFYPEAGPSMNRNHFRSPPLYSMAAARSRIQ